ncbi:MAG: hypothetical protein IID05_08665 [Gemmatimonadetes bacterium]|nr:hypothetical protein [Gemmatimonadota bacterium]
MRRRELYPALAAWRKRVGDTPPSRWAFDNLWRAAMAEIDASATKDNSHREQQYQREAMALLLGEPLHKVRLTRKTMRRYLKAIAMYERKAAA